MITHLNALLDDLTLQQYRDLIAWLWAHNWVPTRANLKLFRKLSKLTMDDTD